MPKEIAPGERLDSWKEIATYLGRNERTAVRWEKEKGLPIHRIPGGQRQGVFAYSGELDKWLAGSNDTKNGGDVNESDSITSIAPRLILEDPPLESPVPTPSASKSPPTTRMPLRRRALYLAAGFMAALFLVAAYGYIDSRLSARPPQLIKQEQLTANDLEKQGLLTDSNSLYFGQEQDGWYALASMPVDGGPIRLLWSPSANVLPVGLSPDGRELLALTSVGVEWNRELWVVPLDRGEPRRLANIMAHSAAWSPDGRMIAFAAGNEIYLTPVDGATPAKVGSFAALPFSLLWSPDSKYLYFALEDVPTDKVSLWGQLSGDGMKTITLRPLPPSIERWNDLARADRSRAYSVCEIKSKPPVTPVCLVQFAKRWWEPPVQIAPLRFVQVEPYTVASAENSSRLFVLSKQHARATFISFEPRLHAFRQILPGVSGTFLDYSQDDKWVAYVSFRDDSLWVSKADGSGIRQLTFPPEIVELPRWSPDGRRIAYMSRHPDRPWRIYIVQLDTGATREASEGNDSQGAPTWSPDGRFLVYGNVNCENTHSCAIHRIDLTSGREETLPDSSGLSTARWSPDGRSIAALDLERHQLLLFDVKTRTWRKLADSLVENDLSWSSDSKYLYACIPGIDVRIVRISAQDGHEETVLNLHYQDRFDLASNGDLQFSVSPDDSVILHRELHSEEIYSYDLQYR